MIAEHDLSVARDALEDHDERRALVVLASSLDLRDIRRARPTDGSDLVQIEIAPMPGWGNGKLAPYHVYTSVAQVRRDFDLDSEAYREARRVFGDSPNCRCVATPFREGQPRVLVIGPNEDEATGTYYGELPAALIAANRTLRVYGAVTIGIEGVPEE